jgi:hypothetical protein
MFPPIEPLPRNSASRLGNTIAPQQQNHNRTHDEAAE